MIIQVVIGLVIKDGPPQIWIGIFFCPTPNCPTLAQIIKWIIPLLYSFQCMNEQEENHPSINQIIYFHQSVIIIKIQKYWVFSWKETISNGIIKKVYGIVTKACHTIKKNSREYVDFINNLDSIKYNIVLLILLLLTIE